MVASEKWEEISTCRACMYRIYTDSIYAMLLGCNRTVQIGAVRRVWYKVYASQEGSFSVSRLFSFDGVQSDCINAMNACNAKVFYFEALAM